MNTIISSLSKNEDFKKILNGSKISNKYTIIFYRKIPLQRSGCLNLSIIVKKKLGSAVLRNKIKRRLRNIVNHASKNININLKYSYLFIAKKNVFDDDYNIIKEYIFNDLKKIKT